MTPAHPLTIVMYHYVRDLENTRFPGIKGLELSAFVGQIAYLRNNYNIVRMEEVIAALDDGIALPEKPVLLTFDDSYLEHYTHVFPILHNLGLQGSFYPPVKAILEKEVLDVNKLHFILASVPETKLLVEDLFAAIDANREEHGLRSNDAYYQEFAIAKRFDPPPVVFLKNMLQHGLPEALRGKILRSLFAKYIDVSEVAFSQELYMSVDQIRLMQRCGMHIGSHGYEHIWLNRVSKERQETEIDRSLELLRAMGADMNCWTMCYPYGGYDDSLIDVISRRGAKLALTTKVNVARLERENRFKLERLDTNDLPCNGTSTNVWFDRG